MKRCLRPLLLAAAAAGPAFAAEGSAVSARFVDPDAAEHAEVRTLGERAINRLAATLGNEVAVATSKGGADKAVEFCHLKALPLTGEVLSGMPRITGIKRTSLKLRNPANAPDAAEQLALKRVEREIERGVLPKVLLQEVDLPAGKSEWRVYRPIGVAPQCVMCHGAPEAMPPELQKSLKARYPADEATGYTAGQWRGLIRVTVGAAPPPPPAPKAPTPARKKA
jgi:hypothetical protein